MNHLLLTREVVNIAEITDIVSADTCGAVSLFIGTTRDSFEEKKVLSLEYEAYEPMALKQMESICQKLRKQWPDIINIAIYHRLGLVPVRQTSVVIAISSPHRKTSLNAVASAIEELKKSVPIWKKEKYEDNECSWKENEESNEADNEKSLQFDKQICKVNESYKPPNKFVQISVGEDEIDRRINCFVKRKRNEIDFCNIMDYTERQKRYEKEDNQNNDLETCARVNSSIIKQQFSKGHLKANEADNEKSLQFDKQICKVDESYKPPNKFVQISVGEDEIDRRINCFVKRKRNEIDFCNIMDYTQRQKRYEKEDNQNNDLETCARVNSSIIKQQFSKGHLKVKRVENSVGPQMRPDYLNALDKLMTPSGKNSIQNNLPLEKLDHGIINGNPQIQTSEILNHSTIIDRMKNIERHLNISPSSMSDIYKRLKNMEDRILYLECISPEYQNFLQVKYNTGKPHCSKKGTGKTCFSPLKSKVYNADDIDSIIQGFGN